MTSPRRERVEESCGTCRYYQEFEPPEPGDEPDPPDDDEPDLDMTTGVCRRYPPKLLSACSCRQTAFPEVSDSAGWCGEYTPAH